MLFALQCGLAAPWKSWGVEPAAVLGHSAGGRLAAACAAGILSLTDGLRLVAARGRLTGGLPEGEGAMSATRAPQRRSASLSLASPDQSASRPSMVPRMS